MQQAGGFHLSRTTWIVIGLVAAAAVIAYILIQRYRASNAAATSSTSPTSGYTGSSLPLVPSAGVAEGSANPSAGSVVPNQPSTTSGTTGELASAAGNSTGLSPAQRTAAAAASTAQIASTQTETSPQHYNTPQGPAVVPIGDTNPVSIQATAIAQHEGAPANYPYASFSASQEAVNRYVAANPGKPLPSNLAQLKAMGY